jgi:tRNA threonylcarbamoyladenosine biosynthesis protein TsaB
MILSLETSTTNCSVALHTIKGELIALKERNEQNIHASMLFVFIGELMKEHSITYPELKAIAVSKGPGSYTGLRIGVSAAKGLCYSLDLPLISVNTLYAMALLVKDRIETKDAMLVPMLDARRMEVYNAVYDMNLNEIIPTRATIIDAQSFNEYKDGPIYFFGDGMPKCKEILSAQNNTLFIEDIVASASGIGIAALKKFTAGEFEDVAYFEPYYLKEFVTQSTFNKK